MAFEKDRKLTIRVVILTIVFSLILGLAPYISGLSSLIGFHEHYLSLIIFFCLQALLVIAIVEKGQRKKKEESSIYILGAITARFISGLFIILIFYMMKVEDIIGLSIQFVILYLLYLIFELIIVLSNLRRNS